MLLHWDQTAPVDALVGRKWWLGQAAKAWGVPEAALHGAVQHGLTGVGLAQLPGEA